MRRLAVVLVFGLVLALAGCKAGWPEDEKAILLSECGAGIRAPGSLAEKELAACQCVYDELPRRLKWSQFQAWHEAPKLGAQRDAAVTSVVAEVTAACARANR